MRYFLGILTIILFLADCSNNNKVDKSIKTRIVKSFDTEQLENDRKFANWLQQYSLKSSDFIDTSSFRAIELWAYYDKLTKEDSLDMWYPSHDSSYYLLTNFNRDKRKESITNIDAFNYRFLDDKSELVYIGLISHNNGKYLPLDHFWYDQKTIFILDQYKNDNSYELIRLTMNVDSLWSFKTD
jgi:hypothetical protein